MAADEKTKIVRQRSEPVRDVLLAVHDALREKGYNPVGQLASYLLTGDPAYITSHRNARGLIRGIERDAILEAVLQQYLEGKSS
ncbi:MAG TPA: IreB family regulatory phosphoprotein [Clostridiales bacterium]|nr:IreB family regulatory phosphoprotein [Clostridiales bacterium]